MRKSAARILSEEEIFAEEDLVIDIQFLLQEMMLKHSMSRSELAQKVGISRARLTQLMRPNANPTVRTLARIFQALGEEVDIGVKSVKKIIAPSLVHLEWRTNSAANDCILLEKSASFSNFALPTFELEWDEQGSEFGMDDACSVLMACIEAAAA